MKKIFVASRIEKELSKCKYAAILRGLNVPLFLIQYETGESVSNYDYFQVVVNGSLAISFIRDDGSTYSLSLGGENYIIGETDLFTPGEDNVIAEAASSLLTIALDASAHREQLLSNNDFLKLVAATMAHKMHSITNSDAASSSLSQRVLNYITFKCENNILHGIEKTAFRLHCSPRQLQRILCQFEQDALVVKIGKGKYQLKSLLHTSSPHC